MADIVTKVTAAQWSRIREDLEALLEIQQKDDEDVGAYALRLARRANDANVVSDDDWDTLEELTQCWVNGAIDAADKGKPIPLPPELLATPAEEESPPPNKASRKKKVIAKKASGEAPAAECSAEPAEEPPEPKKSKGRRGAAVPTPRSSGGTRGRRLKHGEDAIIVIASPDNPHREGAKDHGKFVQLKRYAGKSLGKAIAAGVEPSYIRYLEKRSLVSFKAA